MRFPVWLLIICPIIAHSQVPLPPGAEPGQAERQMQRPPEPTASTTPLELPALSADTAIPAEAATVRLRLNQVEITGATQFSSAELLAPHRSLIGRDISLTDVYGMAREMTARYRNAGFILSSVIVPAQRISSETVRLQVIEGFVSDVKVDGNVIRPGLISKGKEVLMAAKPLHARQLERFLLLLNDLPGITAQGVLAASPTVTGGAELTIKATRERGHIGIGGTNRGSELQGPNQYEANAGFNSLMGLNDGTTVRYLQAQQRKELQLLSVAHIQRLTSGGLDFTLSGSRSKGEPSLTGNLAAFHLENETTQARLALSYPLLRTRTNNVRLRTTFGYHDGRTDIIGLPLYADKISSARLGLTWDTVDALGGVNIVDVEYSKGLSALSASELGSPTASRPGGDPQYSKATWYVARLQSLGGGFSALLAATGQSAFSNLLSSEEFAFGGEQFGRAYDSSEIVGDEGYAGKLELRYTYATRDGSGLTVYTFGETGRVKRELKLPDELGTKTEDKATDYGAGIRFTGGSWLTGYVEAGRPSDRALGATGEKETRIFGGLIFTARF